MIGITQNCNPGVCEKVLGTIYSDDVGGCAWADEVPGCDVAGKLECYLIICSKANRGLLFALKMKNYFISYMFYKQLMRPPNLPTTRKFVMRLKSN